MTSKTIDIKIVEYREPQDLRMSPMTASLVPKHLTAGRPRSAHLLSSSADKEGALVQGKEGAVHQKEGEMQRVQHKEGDNASIIEQGILGLQSSGEEHLCNTLCRRFRQVQSK
jgi:hypothetical protein